MQEVKESEEFEGTVEFSPEELNSIFTSEKFLETLSTAAEETHKSGYETAFEISVLEEREFVIQNIRKGGTDSMQGEEEIKEVDGMEFFTKKHGDLLHFHFHPGAEGSVGPSGPDLFIFLDERAPSFLGIGQVGEKGRVNILLIKRPRKIITEEDIEDLEESALWSGGQTAQTQGEFLYEPSQRDTQDALSKAGFENFLIRFDRKADGKYKLNKRSQKLLFGLGSARVNLVFP